MGLKLLVIVLFLKIVVAKIGIDVKVKNQEADLTYDGSEARIVTDDEIHTLIGRDKLRRAFIEHLRQVGMYHESESCGEAERVLSIKSATVKRLNMQPVIVMSQDFENLWNHNIKVNVGISHNIENTLTTSWSKEREYSVTEDVEYEVNINVNAGFSLGPLSFGGGGGSSYGGSNGFSFTTKGGVNEEKTKSKTIGNTCGVEVELKPGDAVTAVLTANAGSLEIEVVHQAYIKGNVPIQCDCDISSGFGIHVDKACESIEGVMESGGIKNNLTTTETIKFSYYVEGKVSVYEKKSGQLIL